MEMDYLTEKLFDIIIFYESLYYIDSIKDIQKISNNYIEFLNSNGKIIIPHYYKAKNSKIILE